MLQLDGAQGEGGGQVLRMALALSSLTGTSFRIAGIRAGRSKPGLLRQHLTAVKAAAEICGAEVSGAELGSNALEFSPGALRGGEYAFKIGSAGSCTLVFQTVVLPLLHAGTASTVAFEGGTHNPMAPPFEFLDRVFVPMLRRMGADISLKLERHGFYPAGGGRFVAHIEPVRALLPLTLLERGAVTAIRAEALVSNLAEKIASRELTVMTENLALTEPGRVSTVDSAGPGNVASVEIEAEQVTERFTMFGDIAHSAERVAGRLVNEVRRYLKSEAPVGEHLADQLVLPCALAGGTFRALPLSAHAQTAIAVMQQFLPVGVEVVKENPAWSRVTLMK